MTVLRLGVVDVPYSNGKTTTGDVAEILEDKYGIMSYFWEVNQHKIVLEIENGLNSVLENVLLGAPPPTDPFLQGAAQIEKMFAEFLSSKQMDGKIGGVPTAASLKGISHRFKNKKGSVRPSFIDTGLYETSFKAWVD